MTPGMLLRFREPLTDAERAEVLTVIEDRGNRVLVVSSQASGLPIAPTFVYLKSDMEAA